MPTFSQPDHSEPREQSLPVDIATCIRFFSRIPIPALGPDDVIDQPPDFRRTARAIPLAGLLISLPAACVLLLFSATALPDLVVATSCVALTAILTGCLHEDGLTDVFDGFFGGHTREKRLLIMHDSRIGTFGALGMMLTVLLRIALLAQALDAFGAFVAAVLYITSEALGRCFMVIAWNSQPSANPGGLGQRFGLPDWEAAIWAVLSALFLTLVTTLVVAPLSGMIAGLVSAAMAYGLVLLARRKIGGMSGDVLGALQQIASLAFLFGLFLL